MLVAGIDPHATRVAVAVLTIEGELLLTDEVPLPRTDDWREWAGAVREFVTGTVRRCEREYGGTPVIATIERGDWAGRNVRVALRHAESVGATAAEMVRAAPGALVELVGPRRWRQLAGVEGGGKVAVRELVTARFPDMARVKSQDQHDAVAIALAGLALVVTTDEAAGPENGGPSPVAGPSDERS